MGRTVQRKLANVLSNRSVRVRLYTEVLPADEQFDEADNLCAEVHLVDDGVPTSSFTFDVSDLDGVLYLNMDFNTYAGSYARKTNSSMPLAVLTKSFNWRLK